MEGGSQPQEAQPQGLPICPRCGQPYRYLERRKIGNNVYYYAVHYEGYERGPDGRPRPKLRKCYLGPAEYIEVTKTHSDLGMTFKGLIEGNREMDYMEALANTIEARLRDGSLRPEEALELAKKLEGLTELARRLRDYAVVRSSVKEAVNETAAKPQPPEAPPKTSQTQAAEAGQDKAEAYRALMTLTGLPPEDIERQLTKLKEALKELKNSR